MTGKSTRPPGLRRALVSLVVGSALGYGAAAGRTAVLIVECGGAHHAAVPVLSWRIVACVRIEDRP